MSADRRFILAAVAGVILILAAAVSDFFTGGFWERHAMLASLVANLLVVAVTVVIVNELLDRRDRRRWSLLAQNVLFALLQSARATWSGLVEVLRLTEVHSGAVEPLLSAAAIARDMPRVSEATWELLADPERRARLQRVCVALSAHTADVIAKWAPVMVGAGPYAEVFDRHVELAARVQWLADVLAHNEPVDDSSFRDRALTRSSVASEHADEMGEDARLHNQLLAIVKLATDLDRESREHAFGLVPGSWWVERGADLIGESAAPVEPAQ